MPFPDKSLMGIRTVLIIMHLIGLVVGLGAATVADVLFMGCLLNNRMTEDQFASFKRVTDLVVVGLLILGASGFGFIAFYALTDPSLIANPKLWAKLGIVVVLSINGFFMHDFIMPLIGRNLNRPLFSVPAIIRNRWLLFGCGAISMTSWYAALVLGVWKEINFKVSYWEIFSSYAVLCTLAVISSPLLGRAIIAIAEKVAPAALQEVFEGRTVWGAKGSRGDVGPCYALLRKELRRADRQSESMSLVSVKFEVIDDIRTKLGGIAAEQFEKEITALLHGMLRDHDHLAELGRGKYLVILPITDESGAAKVLGRFHRILSAYRFDAQDFITHGVLEPMEAPFQVRHLTSKPTPETTPEELIETLSALAPLSGESIAARLHAANSAAALAEANEPGKAPELKLVG
jgi:GGDEF domain-containing protein